MFGTLKTLMTGANARAEEHVRQIYSVELIEQKIREAQDALKGAKCALASLIQRNRSEARLIATLQTRVADLMERAAEAQAAGRTDMALQAAQAVADMENEISTRQDTASRLETRILRLRASVETAHRRIVDLKQGAIAAKAVSREHEMQKRLGRTVSNECAMDEAEDLIKSVLGRDDPLEQREILRGIEDDLSHDGLADRMADAGFGPATRTTAKDVLARLTAQD